MVPNQNSKPTQKNCKDQKDSANALGEQTAKTEKRNSLWYDLLRPAIKNLKPYASARSLDFESNLARLGQAKVDPKDDKIFLDANENPMGDEFPYNRYPDPQPLALLDFFAQIYAVDRSQILMGRGSDEAIDTLIRSFCEAATEEICICPPTYGVYEVTARIQGCGIKKINHVVKQVTGEAKSVISRSKAKSEPTQEQGFSLPIKEILQTWSSKTKVLFICSPNNPTGHATPLSEITQLCEGLAGKGIVVVDEAYQEFSSQASAISLLAQFPQLVVLRTVSKAYGMAGLRMGVALGDPQLISLLQGVRAPYPIASCVTTELLAQVKTMGPLIDEAEGQIVPDQVHRTINLLRLERGKLSQRLLATGHFSEIFGSEANFVLVRAHDKDRVMNLTQDSGIVLRDRSVEPLLANCLRITIGSASECDHLIKVLS